jgi:CheY-like chemotaxis protein/tetratricopeptide (TPR) repeat protein
LGSANQTEGSQETAKNLITKSIELFENLRQPGRVAEARGDLAVCYWREGAFDEARVTLKSALEALSDDDLELRAVLLIRAGIVEMDSQRLNEALRVFNEARPLVEQAENDPLKGSFHMEFALLFRRLAVAESRQDFFDQAMIENAAASFYHEKAGNIRYLARVENNLGYLYFTIGQYKDAHEHLDRARKLFVRLKDVGTVAQVDETRARTLLAEGRLRQAERMVKAAVKTLEHGGQQAVLAEALTTQGTILARLGNYQRARDLLQRAIEIAQTAGDLEGAGRAYLSRIEELGSRTPTDELASDFRSAAELLASSQDPATNKRLIACSTMVIDALADDQIQKATEKIESWEGFSLRAEMTKIERLLVTRALREAGGSVTKASKLLGLKHHQSLISVLESRHRDLNEQRSVRKRRQHLFSKPKRSKKKTARHEASARPNQLSVLHVEDHQLVARMVEEILGAEGFHVQGCASGLAAWEMLKTNTNYDVLIVDNNLPGLSGLELVLRVRSIPHRRHLPIIMLSGDDIEREAWRAGVDAFLHKAEAVDQLTGAIKRLLKEKEEDS